MHIPDCVKDEVKGIMTYWRVRYEDGKPNRVAVLHKIDVLDRGMITAPYVISLCKAADLIAKQEEGSKPVWVSYIGQTLRDINSKNIYTT